MFEDLIVEDFSDLGKETVIQVQKAQSCTQDQLKEEHTQTHWSQRNKN